MHSTLIYPSKNRLILPEVARLALSRRAQRRNFTLSYGPKTRHTLPLLQFVLTRSVVHLERNSCKDRGVEDDTCGVRYVLRFRIRVEVVVGLKTTQGVRDCKNEELGTVHSLV